MKVFTTKQDLVDVNYAAHINDLQEEVVALQQILGTNPQGASSTVKDRIASVETGKAAASHTHGTADITSGILGVARGGTGLSTVSAGHYLKGNGTGAFTTHTPAQVLADIGAAAAGHNHDSVYAPINARDQFSVFTREGTLKVLIGKGRLILPWAITILGVRAVVDTAPTGASLVIDVNKNGTTLFTTQANRPTIPAGSNSSAEAVPDVTAAAAGDYLTIDIDQVGSTVAGADLSVTLTYRRA